MTEQFEKHIELLLFIIYIAVSIWEEDGSVKINAEACMYLKKNGLGSY